jgi:Predicted Permease Membrane Region
LANIFRLGLEGFGSQKLYAPESRDGTLLLLPGQESYAVLGRAYGELQYAEYTATLYRQYIDTPYVNQHGMSSGPKFAATVTATGFLMLGLGAAVLVAFVLPILVLGLLVFRMPYDEVAGIVAGACGNPAILAYSNKLAPTDRPDIGYAMIFPGMTIVKILFVDIVPVFFSG